MGGVWLATVVLLDRPVVAPRSELPGIEAATLLSCGTVAPGVPATRTVTWHNVDVVALSFGIAG